MTKMEVERFWAALRGILEACARQQRPLGDAAELSFLLNGRGSELLRAPLVGKVTMWDGVALLAGHKLSVLDEMKIRRWLGGPELDENQAYDELLKRLAERVEEMLGQSLTAGEARDSTASTTSSSVA